MNIFLENHLLSSSRYSYIIRDTKVPPNNTPILDFDADMIECKKMKARVLENYCGMHVSCKGCEREFVNVFKE